jgi:diaminohydroxyphosphoribosylaminopyrimidine deaminase/5-amino-6-(5-phosphoribosylamino)uracil reductase
MIAVTGKASHAFVNSMLTKWIIIIKCPEKNGKVDLSFLIKKIGERNIDSILLEGGSTLNFSAIQEGIVDKVYSFISPKLIGGKNASTPVGGKGFKNIHDAIMLNISEVKRFDEDLMIESYIVRD